MNIRSAAAIAFGIVLVLGAFHLRDQEASEQGAVVAVSSTDARQARGYIQATDSDGDGISDWEEELTKRTLERAVGLPEVSVIDAHYEAPTTLTGQFAEDFFREYISGNINGGITPETQSKFLADSVEELELRSREALLTDTDIVLARDNEFETLRAYGNSISAIIGGHPAKAGVSEISILETALDTNNANALRDIEPIASGYSAILADTLRTPVPPQLRNEHLVLVNAYQAVQIDIAAMQQAFTDPLFSMIRLKRYEEDVTTMHRALINIYRQLDREDIVYASDEPGSFGQSLLK